MATLTIKNIPDDVYRELKSRAAAEPESGNHLKTPCFGFAAR
jgi:plasmid stability protein